MVPQHSRVENLWSRMYWLDLGHDGVHVRRFPVSLSRTLDVAIIVHKTEEVVLYLVT